MSERLTVALAQPVVLDNRAGANGIIGTDAVAKAAPDGYTLLMTTGGAQTVSPSLYALPYDSIRDLAPISMVATLGTMLVVHPSVPARTLQEFVALAKAQPGKLNYAAGSSLLHLVGETFKLATGTDIVAIPYKGTGPQLSAVLAGEAAMTIDPFTAVQHVKSGRLRALAVLSRKRSSLLPDVPTLQEAGVSGVELDAWAGMLAPAGTPAPVLKRLHDEVAKIVALPEFRDRLAALNYEPAGSTPEQFSQLIATDTAKWAKAVKATNFKVQ
ncbi:tripartite tricarboxylate transporter substrate binding protein [Alicycliphilus denitrificans]|uniref:tripartite tricarboxylate transporter substrate binding protein n=1 Tax=Alicycliphilus denitrificans TaxID=179636 RepID=UPI0002D8CA6D|nr:tripartite tricarboxylate transporter substrate binding protein [Alicycliphilus denitrificans]